MLARTAYRALVFWSKPPSPETKRVRELWDNTVAVAGLFNELTPPAPPEEPRRGG
jgi:hypothetical protein